MNFIEKETEKTKSKQKANRLEGLTGCREGGDNSNSSNGGSGHMHMHMNTHTHVRALLTCTGEAAESTWNANADSLFRLKSIEINFHQKGSQRQRNQLQHAGMYGRERAKINQPAK